ncbi:hypothetical protein ZIOFF_002542 [Zingiber officinale]|uniref:Uncharacterized protein n=1 Tax=Zingiber officinale TaxID=94328 RepID=A0A8J5I7Q2_ZINOF|nr:hypothetical protein ZIOFF_002542 [Zingiber officinale]
MYTLTGVVDADKDNRPRELQLLVQSSTSLPSESPTSMTSVKEEPNSYAKKLQLLRQHTTEQIRLAAVEKAYIERTRELTTRELDLAKKEFARAKLVCEQAREELQDIKLYTFYMELDLQKPYPTRGSDLLTWEFTNLKYSRVEIDEVQFEWAECMLDYI